MQAKFKLSSRGSDSGIKKCKWGYDDDTVRFDGVCIGWVLEFEDRPSVLDWFVWENLASDAVTKFSHYAL